MLTCERTSIPVRVWPAGDVTILFVVMEGLKRYSLPLLPSFLSLVPRRKVSPQCPLHFTLACIFPQSIPSRCSSFLYVVQIIHGASFFPFFRVFTPFFPLLFLSPHFLLVLLKRFFLLFYPGRSAPSARAILTDSIATDCLNRSPLPSPSPPPLYNSSRCSKRSDTRSAEAEHSAQRRFTPPP